jgi:hypothetical protein
LSLELLEARQALTATIDITQLPAYANSGLLQGKVGGVTPSDYAVATYLQIEGAGWWSKPAAASPTVSVSANGSFSVNVVTGGLDARATIYCVALIPQGSSPALALGSGRVPRELDDLAVAVDCQERYGRTVSFAGYSFAVKDAPLPVGPGGNRFSAAPGDVFVDEAGLHLTVARRNDAWQSTEVILPTSLGYGTYSFQTKGQLDDLDPEVTLGLFTWDAYGDEESGASPHREIDFEIARWGHAADSTNAQMVVQPFQTPGNLQRFTVPRLTDDLFVTQFFTWSQDKIEFVAVRGKHTPLDFTEADVINQFTYRHDPSKNHYVPTPGRAKIHMNLWLRDGATALARGDRVEAVIAGFQFFPPNAPPQAMGDHAATDEDRAVVIPVLVNDQDTGGAALDVVDVTRPSHGTAAINPDNTITYTPDLNYHGSDAFMYTVSDGELTAAATVAVTVRPVNDAPTDIVFHPFSFTENSLGAEVGELGLVDPDANDTHAWTVSDGRFEVIEGVLKLKSGVRLDFEAEPLLSIQITATDSGSPPRSRTETLIIAVGDAVDSPWQNAALPQDVNGKEGVTLADLLDLVSALRLFGVPHALPVPPAPDRSPPPFLDVNGDFQASLADLLLVVQHLRSQTSRLSAPEVDWAFAEAERMDFAPLIPRPRAKELSDEKNRISDGWRGPAKSPLPNLRSDAAHSRSNLAEFYAASPYSRRNASNSASVSCGAWT